MSALNLSDFFGGTGNTGGGNSGGGNTGGGSSASGLLFGDGAPDAALGVDTNRYIDFADFTVYEKTGDAWAVDGSFKAPGGILSGDGAPNDALGADGQFYIDKVDKNLYVKAAGAWALDTSLIGPQGPSGGREIFAGAGVPASALGKDGDHYVNTTSGEVYAKAAGAWALNGDTLKGPQGDVGIQGPAGSPGGFSFRTGNGAPNDALGLDNDAYADRDNRGRVYIKSAGTWIETDDYVGGNIITSGNGLPADAAGNEGDIYVRTDEAGRAYIKNSVGVYVATDQYWFGPKGDQGDRGEPGVGLPGVSFHSGIGAPNNADTYTDLTTYLDRGTGQLYEKQAGIYVDTGYTMAGPEGPPGAAGAIGPQGVGFTGGDGAPDDADGSPDGTTYLDRLSGAIYEKQAGAYVDTTQSLRGPQGPAGEGGGVGVVTSAAMADASEIQTAVNTAGNGGRVSVPKQATTIAGRVKIKDSVEVEGEQRIRTQLNADALLTEYMFEFGDREDATPNGNADFAALRNFYLIGNDQSSGAILIPSEIEHVPAWGAPSRFFDVKDITIQDFTGPGARAISIHAHSGFMDRVKINNCTRGIHLGKAVNACDFGHLNITGTIVSAFSTDSENTGIEGKVTKVGLLLVQNHNPTSDVHPAILLDGGAPMEFEALYVENNQLGLCKSDAFVPGAGKVFGMVGWYPTAGVTDAVCFQVSATDFVVNKADMKAEGKYFVEFSGADAKAATLANMHVENPEKLQAIHHDRSSFGGVTIDSNNGPNLLRNSSFQVAQLGDVFNGITDGDLLLDVFRARITQANGAVINVSRDVWKPNASFAHSMKIDITAAGTPAAGRRIRIGQPLRVDNLRGRTVSAVCVLRASAAINLDDAFLYVDDGQTVSRKRISSLDVTHETFWMPHDVSHLSNAVEVGIELVGEAGTGALPVASIYLVQPQLHTGYDQPGFHVRSTAEEKRVVGEVLRVRDTTTRDPLGVCTMMTTTEAHYWIEYDDMEAQPAITFEGTWEALIAGANIATTQLPAVFDQNERRAKVVLALDGGSATAGDSGFIQGDNVNGANKVVLDAVPA